MVLSSNDALKKSIPASFAWINHFGRIGLMIFRWRVQRLQRKYPRPYVEAELKACLAKLLVGIQQAENGYLLGRFSFAGMRPSHTAA
jgi:hypothetical protein